MQTLKKFLPFALFCLGVLAVPYDAHALRLGPFEVNPFLALTERFTDNVFDTNTDRKSDFSTVVTPGVQVIFPRVKKNYHSEVILQADLERFNKYTSQNADNYKAMEMFEVKFPGGLELGVKDEFNRNHDPQGVNPGVELNFYRTNLAQASIGYNLFERFKVKLEYSNYFVHYDAEGNDFENRTDNTLATYVYYALAPKTAVFVEYDFTNVDFRTSNDLDSKEHRFYGGVTWDITGKTKGTVKGGYETKNFQGPDVNGFKGFVMELVVDHNFSLHQSVKVKGIRRTNETNVAGNDFFTTTGGSVEYFHRFTGKITGKADFSYGVDVYHGGFPRRDGTWQGGGGLVYEFRKWLRTEVKYVYTKRDSSENDFSYRNNTYYLKVVASL